MMIERKILIPDTQGKGAKNWERQRDMNRSKVSILHSCENRL